ncbi:lipoprotein [Rhizobiaceae bacterium n13]|uniref:Lipoprotein n=1 Tax=Ferirhizobium litorale TaxID=2927786 RepID=A0AAE3QD37_9HYPH|nr:lipoprotein [Fererhizobium litorale]MDI7862609.1 lipoprotein [Fererhizobium litorale]MDI7923557.1 lipoprotein [Fererhizobium litorale]
MPQTFRHMIRLTAVLVVTGLVAVGCGRKGDLDPPSTPNSMQNKRTDTTQPQVQERKFFLDPLL